MKFEIFEGYSTLGYMVTEKDPSFGCSFSMALHTGEDADQIMQNRAVLAANFGEEYRFCGIRQIHSARVHVAMAAEGEGWKSIADAVEADAVITNLPKLVLTILTADCVPILLYDPEQGAIGAVHAGWKGTIAEILPRTIAKMQAQYGSRAENILIAIGPAIGQCCYEVNSEVAIPFMGYDGAVLNGAAEGKYQLDLKRVNQIQALKTGIMPEHIELTPFCTSCAKDRFFSYRAEQGCSGRFISAITLV